MRQHKPQTTAKRLLEQYSAAPSSGASTQAVPSASTLQRHQHPSSKAHTARHFAAHSSGAKTCHSSTRELQNARSNTSNQSPKCTQQRHPAAAPAPKRTQQRLQPPSAHSSGTLQRHQHPSFQGHTAPSSQAHTAAARAPKLENAHTQLFLHLQ